MRSGSWSSNLLGRRTAAPGGRDGRSGLNPPISGYGRSVCPPASAAGRLAHLPGGRNWRGDVASRRPRRPPGTAPGCVLGQIVVRWEAILTGAVAPLNDLSGWARGSLLVIVLLVLGAILLTRLAEWARGRIMEHIDAHASEDDELVRSEAAKHRHVVAQVVTWTVLAVIYVVTAVLIVEHLGVPLAGLVAPAALLSAALGFGLQRFVQDIGAGLFITGERQYGFGDVVRISVAGVSEPAFGTVEEVTLRVTRIRSVSGEVIITPNGQITQVTNLSRDWARAVIDVPVPATVEVSRVTDALKRVGEEAWNDDQLRKMMLDPPTVMGVERIEVDTFSVRMVARTLPGVQFEVGRELRARVAIAFRNEGINASAELDTGRATGGAS